MFKMVQNTIKLNSKDIAKLINQLKSITESNDGIKKFSKPVNSTQYDLNSTKLTSWRMNEFMYKKPTNPFPTQARGLFTVEEPEPRIVIRGYNKFFNLNEVPSTKKEHLISDTKGPYLVTVKENGCIIFISSFQNELVIASKHSLSSEHADRGKYWLQRHLKEANVDEGDLIQFLEENQVTLCFELCDDEFEEHILPYSKQLTGLHLHGINLNQSNFATWPMDLVVDTAQRFGFLNVDYETYNSIEDVFNMFNEIEGAQGHYKGRPIEGVVVRCFTQSEGNDFFFKFKLDEPYLLFREFRELTKYYLSNPTKFQFKFRYLQSERYLSWIKMKLSKDPKLFEGILRNQGIVKCREVFYEDTKLEIDCTKINGSAQTKSILHLGPNDSVKYILMTVGTIGCGKSSLCRALTELYPDWGHVQSDQCKGASSFIKRTLNLLKNHDVVIVEKNHHVANLRNQLMGSVVKDYPYTKLVVLLWDPLSNSLQDTMSTIYTRVLKRGKNHPNLTPQSSWDLEKIIESFYKCFEPLDNDDYTPDHIINLNTVGNLKENLQTTLTELGSEQCDRIAGSTFKTKDIEKSIQLSLESSVVKSSNQEMIKDPNYYGIAILAPLFDLIVSKLNLNDDHPLMDTFNDLFAPKTNLVYHVTLIHSNHKELSNWDYYASNRNHILGSTVTIEVNRVLFIKSTIIILLVNCVKDNGGNNITKQLPTSNSQLHITMGWARNQIKAYMSNDIIQQFKNSNHTKSVDTIDDIDELVNGVQSIKIEESTFEVESIELNPPLSLSGRVTAFKR